MLSHPDTLQTLYIDFVTTNGWLSYTSGVVVLGVAASGLVALVSGFVASSAATGSGFVAFAEGFGFVAAGSGPGRVAFVVLPLVFSVGALPVIIDNAAKLGNMSYVHISNEHPILSVAQAIFC